MSGMSGIKAYSPLSRLREREGPNAEHWEGEGFPEARDDLSGSQRIDAVALPLTLPLLRNGPLPLPQAGEGQIRL